MGEVKKWLAALQTSFDAMRTTGPRALLPRLKLSASEEGLTEDPVSELIAHAALKNSGVREELSAKLSQWDYEPAPQWAKAAPNTAARRREIYALLNLPPELTAALDENLPPKLDVERDLVITDHTDGWYTPEFLRDREFYWPRYRDYLKTKKGMSDDSLNALHESANRIIENLAPPHTKHPQARRGLVVGYVQSGKTTNFTAVVAKAIDAGYRLIIVLAGTIDLLRLQTQRRLDMELVGVENIGVREDDADREYQNDPAFPSKFISYGQKPGLFGAPNIRRLTTSNGDFRSFDASFHALEMDELKDGKKAYLPESIKNTNVRLIVIKKVTPRLKRLVREIKHINDIREDIPTLIIDDESDQASVNTVDPDKATAEERSKTNKAIVDLLTLLPRAQYVGYTATPFANVFVDVDDAADIYPRDFIVSLPRPAGYMGVRDFHDLDAEGDDAPRPNKAAFVRQFSDTSAESSLDEALDAFVLSGAIKLFRKDRSVHVDVRHHTMMVHETVKNAAQSDRAEEILQRWRSAGYNSTGRGPARLKTLLEGDFRKVSRDREPQLPFPASYEELKPYVGQALALISNEPVLVVNGAKGGEDPGFDTKENVWKVLVGGAKLSRGFTVEGLTVTYFRRKSKAQDTMMQMGRWFGYRGGYRDLVRLYLESGEDSGYDLYDAFESICRDEEAFRAQLSKYARPADGSPPLRPIQVPAVVFNSFPLMTPTSKNKMFNARLVSAVMSNEWRSPTAMSFDKRDVLSNWNELANLVGNTLVEVEIGGVPWLKTEVSNTAYVRFLRALKWAAGADVLGPQCEFFLKNEFARKRWVVLLPQVKSAIEPFKLGARTVSVHGRSLKNGSFNIFSSSRHVEVVNEEAAKASGPLVDVGVALVYPTREIAKKGQEASLKFEQPLVGLSMFHPKVPSTVQQAVFTVRSAKFKDDATYVPK